MEILKDSTKSICPVCYKEVNAQIIGEDSVVCIIKNCSEHGVFKILLEKNVIFYKAVMNNDFLEKRIPFECLTISLNHQCNLNCNICYLPERDDRSFSLEDIEKVISIFPGRWIRLSGGEPTLREDLPQLITYINKKSKIPILLTNGVKLNDIHYVRKLKDAGLRIIHFSFNAFRDEVYKKIDGQALLKIKLNALRNIKRTKIKTSLSVMLVKGVNEVELKKIYRFALKNSSFIKQLRIRSAIKMGKYSDVEHFYLSEILKMISNIVGVSEERLISHSLKRGLECSIYNKIHMPCHMEIDLFPLLMEEMGIQKNGNSLGKKIKYIFKLLPRVGIKNIIMIILRKLAKKDPLLQFRIYIRSFPDKYRIDLGEMQRCPSAYVTHYGDLVPFCYALIQNDRNHIL